MEFNYVAYDKYRKVIKGKVNATNEGAAHSLITSNGYQVLSLKAQPAYLSSEKLNMSLTNISPKEIIMFSRQMALLLSSGTDIVAALDLLHEDLAVVLFLAHKMDSQRGQLFLGAYRPAHPHGRRVSRFENARRTLRAKRQPAAQNHNHISLAKRILAHQPVAHIAKHNDANHYERRQNRQNRNSQSATTPRNAQRRIVNGRHHFLTASALRRARLHSSWKSTSGLRF